MMLTAPNRRVIHVTTHMGLLDAIARIEPGLVGRTIARGHEVRLTPQAGLAVAFLERGRSLVLRGGIPMGDTAPPYDFIWAFVLRDEPDGSTRLLVRERYAYMRPWARFLVEPAEAVSFMMTQRMLRGIRDRAERIASNAAQPSDPREWA
jgi:hypothetical protein